MNDTQWLNLSNRLDKMEGKLDVGLEKIAELRTEIAVLKVKSGIWGSLAGFVVVFITFLIQKVLK